MNNTLFKKKSFTLIELLISLSIFSVIAVSIYNTYWGGMRIHKRSNTVHRVQRDARWIYNSVLKDVQEAVSYSYGEDYEEKVCFLGEEDEVSFLISTDEGLKRVRYYLEKEEDLESIHKVIIGKRYKKLEKIVVRLEEEGVRVVSLVREEKDFIDDLQTYDQEPGQIEILSDQIEEGSLKFAYPFFEGSEDAKTIVWSDEWAGDNKDFPIPKGLYMEFRLVNEDNPKEIITFQKRMMIPQGELIPKETF